jgi:hypothetical protein
MEIQKVEVIVIEVEDQKTPIENWSEKTSQKQVKNKSAHKKKTTKKEV